MVSRPVKLPSSVMLLLLYTSKAFKTPFQVSRNYSSPFIWYYIDIILIPQTKLTCCSCSRSQNVFRHLDIICQTFGKLISSLDSSVVILFLYSLAYCFLIHSKKHLWSNLTLDCFLGMVVRFDSLTNSNLGEMK